MCDSGTFTTILNKHRRFIIVVAVIILRYIIAWYFVHLDGVFFYPASNQTQALCSAVFKCA